jgi:hypothetical protein
MMTPVRSGVNWTEIPIAIRKCSCLDGEGNVLYVFQPKGDYFG